MSQNQSAISRLCRLIRWGSLIFIIGVLAIYLFTWFAPAQRSFGHHPMLLLHLAGIPANALANLSWDQRLLMASISIPYLAVLIWAFYRLQLMLKGFERGDFFERATVGHLRAFAGLLLLAKGLALVAMHARAGVLIHMLGHERVRAVINLSSDDMAVLLMCALFFLIARMMEEGRRLAEENREFV